MACLVADSEVRNGNAVDGADFAQSRSSASERRKSRCWRPNDGWRARALESKLLRHLFEGVAEGRIGIRSNAGLQLIRGELFLVESDCQLGSVPDQKRQFTVKQCLGGKLDKKLGHMLLPSGQLFVNQALYPARISRRKEPLQFACWKPDWRVVVDWNEVYQGGYAPGFAEAAYGILE